MGMRHRWCSKTHQATRSVECSWASPYSDQNVQDYPDTWFSRLKAPRWLTLFHHCTQPTRQWLTVLTSWLNRGFAVAVVCYLRFGVIRRGSVYCLDTMPTGCRMTFAFVAKPKLMVRLSVTPSMTTRMAGNQRGEIQQISFWRSCKNPFVTLHCNLNTKIGKNRCSVKLCVFGCMQWSLDSPRSFDRCALLPHLFYQGMHAPHFKSWPIGNLKWLHFVPWIHKG